VTEHFYKAFEDQHRGSRELIKSRLNVYLPFITPLRNYYENSQTIDLGCGRGEWLELLQDLGGFDAYGVDLDQGMLAVCEAQGLQYKHQDALTSLIELEDESQSIVTGFHIAEHIPFESLQTLVQQALRVLKPGGLLILETPNPENIVVGTAEFYMDPTHNQPIPPNLLAFVPSHYGFEKTKIVRLQEDQDLKHSDSIQLIDVLKGVSPDYAVVAQKKAPDDLASNYETVFAQDYGLNLEVLAEKYHQQEIQKLAQLTAALEVRFQAAEAKTQAAEAKTLAAQQHVQALLTSKSWQLTKPLRACLSFVQRLLK